MKEKSMTDELGMDIKVNTKTLTATHCFLCKKAFDEPIVHLENFQPAHKLCVKVYKKMMYEGK